MVASRSDLGICFGLIDTETCLRKSEPECFCLTIWPHEFDKLLLTDFIQKTIVMGFSDYIAARQKEFDWLRQGKEHKHHGTKSHAVSICREGGHFRENSQEYRALPLLDK